MGIGVVALATLSIYRTWGQSRENARPPFLSAKPGAWKVRLFDAILGPIAVLLIFVPLWPWILSVEFNFPWQKFKFWSAEVESNVAVTWQDFEPGFEVAVADLLEKLSREAIELNERVDDPLHAVPDGPFGHLNKVWQAFVGNLEPDTELWSFSGRWETEYQDYQIKGYVARLGEKIGPHFVTSQRSMRQT